MHLKVLKITIILIKLGAHGTIIMNLFEINHKQTQKIKAPQYKKKCI